MNQSEAVYPLLRGGVAEPIKRSKRYLKIGSAGEVKLLLQQWSDLPFRAEFKVALHLLDERGHPSSKEGESLFKTSDSFTPS